MEEPDHLSAKGEGVEENQMNIEELKTLFDEYANTLDDTRKDEWYSTDRERWNGMTEDFWEWMAKKHQPPPILVKYVVLNDKGNWFAMFPDEEKALIEAHTYAGSHVERWTYEEDAVGTHKPPKKERIT